ncbi:MAG TPA: DNA internalization-related competence protein ComEC/Rec2 [Gemmatimonadales bacterium]|nr:DNA internalization-related competence protein ComEC/Rec2 [Gemmatimonadales bacterium]
MRARPPVLFTAVYGAGLATGLLHFWDPIAVTVVSVVVALVVRRPLTSLLAAALLLGRVSAELALTHETTSCAARLPTGLVRISVRLLEPSPPGGGVIRVRPLDAGCHGTVVARWPVYPELPAGSEAAVAGRWIPRAAAASRPSGMLVVKAANPHAARPTYAERIRTGVGHASQTLYGARAPMVDALILGRRGSFDRDLQDRFAQSGLVHLLSISGFHVGIITAWVFLLCRSARVARARSYGIAAVLSVAYVGFLGWPAPATRAAALAVLVALSRVRQRRVESSSLLSATCLCVLLVDPWAIVDLGGWLSVAALWGASTFTRWSDHALGTRIWWRTLSSSVGATLTTAPITAAALGTVAVVGIVLNFVAIPLAAVAVPGVFASLLAYPLWSGLAAALAGGAGLGLHGLELLATAGAAVPGGHIICPEELGSALPWLAVLAVSLWAVGRHNTLVEAARRWSWSLVGALWLFGIRDTFSAVSDTGSELALHFLDVGQGDAAVLRTPAGRWVLIDAGPRTDRADAGRRVVVPFLLRQRVRELTLAFVSHAHADHLGGLLSVLDRFPSGMVVEPGELVPDSLYHTFLDELATAAIPWHRGRRGERFTLDSVSFTIIHPDPAWSGWGDDVNEDSLVLLIEYRSFQVLFAGDAGFPAEHEMLRHTRPVDLLKVGHHGSRGSTGSDWLMALQPEAAVLSVGRNNYGHPSLETLDRLRRHRVAVWRTDQDGTVEVSTDGWQMTLRSRGRTARYDVR